MVTLLGDVVGYERIKGSIVRPLNGLKVAIHYGCHLLKPSKIMKVDDPDDPCVMEKLVEALGAPLACWRPGYRKMGDWPDTGSGLDGGADVPSHLPSCYRFVCFIAIDDPAYL